MNEVLNKIAEIIEDYNNTITVSTTDPQTLASRKIKFSEEAESAADHFNKKFTEWAEGPGKKMMEEANKIPTVRSSEFKRIGGWIIDTTTKEGKEFVRDFENIPTVSSSEFGPGHYEVN